MKLQSIQVLRGLAAFLVVLYHIRSLEGLSIAANGLTEQPWVSGVFTNGYAGVDLFFVISGFIMVHVTHARPSGGSAALEFLFARATRIYPVWWTFAGMMTIYLLTAHGLPTGPDGWKIHSGTEPTLEYFIRSFLLLPQPEFPVLGVGWTLVHEMHFYVVFSLFVLLPQRFLPGLLVAWGLIVLGGTYLGYDAPYAGTLRELIFYPMTMEFILGAMAGLAISYGLIWRPGIIFLGATLWLLAALSYQGVETEFTLKWGRVLWFGLPCVALVYGLSGLNQQGRLAWMVPALFGALVSIGISQAFGLDGQSADADRQLVTLLAVGGGALTMAAVMVLGWQLGQRAPDSLMATGAVWRRVMDGAVRLGDWSFALYLCHMIVLSALRQLFLVLGQNEALAPYFRLGHPGPLDNLIFLVTGTAASIITAWLAYRFIEKPGIILFGKARHHLFHRSSPEEGAV